MRAGERENCENFAVETESVAGARTVSVTGVEIESVADVVKIESFPMGSGAARVTRGLQSEPDMEARAKITQARTCGSILRKGEPKVFRKDWPASIQGENAEGPELPHATSLPDGTMPTGSTLPCEQRKIRCLPG
jgi:hypothetical protein